ncbi:MAG TPA: hypothetical protein VFH39_01240 [Candidatus Saccharimonadales bacterium]|nr:hypothetical protein [Candidatus Saccharimonadales bacterium]
MIDWFVGGLVVFALLLMAYWFGPQKNRSGTIIIRAHRYAFEAGNTLSYSGRQFAGLSIELPKKLPHMYLDHRVASRFSGPVRTYANDQQVDLEGDFDRYFQLFTPKGNEALALSIMSPDVMQTLMQAAYSYDIEIKADRVNILAGHYAGRLQDEQIAEMEKAARAVLSEIDQKLPTWSADDQAQAVATELKYYDEQSVRLFGRYVGIGVLAIAVSILVATPLFYEAHRLAAAGSDAVVLYVTLGFVAFPIFPILIIYAERTDT